MSRIECLLTEGEVNILKHRSKLGFELASSRQLVFVLGGGHLGENLAGTYQNMGCPTKVLARSPLKDKMIPFRKFDLLKDPISELLEEINSSKNEREEIIIFVTAAVFHAGMITSTPPEEMLMSYETNVLVLHKLIYALFHSRILGPKITIVVFGSGTALSGLPYAGAYGLSKESLLEYLLRIRFELRSSSKIRILYFSPGFFGIHGKQQKFGLEIDPFSHRHPRDLSPIIYKVIRLTKGNFKGVRFTFSFREKGLRLLNRLLFGLPNYILTRLLEGKYSK